MQDVHICKNTDCFACFSSLIFCMCCLYMSFFVFACTKYRLYIFSYLQASFTGFFSSHLIPHNDTRYPGGKM